MQIVRNNAANRYIIGNNMKTARTFANRIMVDNFAFLCNYTKVIVTSCGSSWALLLPDFSYIVPQYNLWFS